jgi:hypothetical protein
MKNALPKYWAVENDGSQLFKDTVIKYLNETYKQGYDGVSPVYYGYDGVIKCFNGTFCEISIADLSDDTQVLTLNQFIQMTTETEFKTGELIEVSDSGDAWVEIIFLAEITGAKSPFICVAKGYEYEFINGIEFHYEKWDKARKITPTQSKKDKAMEELDKFMTEQIEKLTELKRKL